MKVTLTPQRSDIDMSFSNSDGFLEIKLDDQVDVFDFSDLPNGKAESIETSLSPNPVIRAKKVDGEVEVVLVYFYGPNAAEEERTEREVYI